MKTRTQTARSVISILLTLAMMTVMTNSIAGSAGAKEQVEEWLNKVGLEEGWDDEKKRYVSIGRAGFDTPHPELDKTFTARQSLAARSAVLEARANIVEYMGFEMVASANADTVEARAVGQLEARAVGQLNGAIPIAQFESWDKDRDQYEVATVVMWNLAMEKLVRSAIRGESVRVSPGSLSLEQFAGRFEKEKRVNIGGRFRDDKGVVYILGTGFAAVGGGQSLSTARVLAEQIAQEEILMSIYSEISSHKFATKGALLDSEEILERIRSLERKLEAQRNRVARLLQDLDAKKADNLRAATLADRLPAVMDAAIQILDEKYSTEMWTEKKKKYEKTKKRYAKALEEWNTLMKEVEARSPSAVQPEIGIVVHTFEGKEEQRVNQQIQKLSGSKLVDPISQQPVYATIFALSLDDYAKSALE